MPSTDNFFTSNTRVSGQTDHSVYFRIALPGMLWGMDHLGSYRILPYMNDVSAVDTWTLTPPTAAAGHPVPDKEYQVTVNGVSVKFQTPTGTPTPAQLMAGLFSAMRTSPLFYSLSDIELNSSNNVITLKARTVQHELLVVLDPSSDVVAAHTAIPAIATSIPFGRFVGRKPTYKMEQKEGVSQATLIDSASGYEILGITVQSHHTEKTGIGASAIGGYVFGDSMNVMDDTGTSKGMWVETVEPDIVIGDTPYISVQPGQFGKLTKTATGNMSVASKARIVSGSQQSIGNRYITLVQFTR